MRERTSCVLVTGTKLWKAHEDVHALSTQPYITKAYFGLRDPPVKLVKIAIGDGLFGNSWEVEDAPVVFPATICVVFLADLSKVTLLETYPQIIGYNSEVFNYFKEQYVSYPPHHQRGVNPSSDHICADMTST